MRPGSSNSGNASHLLQMRGLKLGYRCANGYEQRVASFTDAWIETIMGAINGRVIYVASFTDAWIETKR